MEMTKKLAQDVLNFVQITGEVIRRVQEREKRAQALEMQSNALMHQLYERLLKSGEIAPGAEKEAQFRLSTHYGSLTLFKQALDHIEAMKNESARLSGVNFGRPSEMEKDSGVNDSENVYEKCFADFVAKVQGQ